MNIHSWPNVAGRRTTLLILAGKEKVKRSVLTHLPCKFFFSDFLKKHALTLCETGPRPLPHILSKSLLPFGDTLSSERVTEYNIDK